MEIERGCVDKLGVHRKIVVLDNFGCGDNRIDLYIACQVLIKNIISDDNIFDFRIVDDNTASGIVVDSVVNKVDILYRMGGGGGGGPGGDTNPSPGIAYVVDNIVEEIDIFQQSSAFTGGDNTLAGVVVDSIGTDVDVVLVFGPGIYVNRYSVGTNSHVVHGVVVNLNIINTCSSSNTFILSVMYPIILN